MSVLLTTPMSRVGKLPSTLPPPSFLQANSASGLALEAHVSVTLSIPSTTGPPAEEDTVTFGGTVNLKMVNDLCSLDLEGFEKVGSKLRARCAPDERQKQEFRGLCACQHASPCPNPVKHQALCEFVQFLTYCVKEVNNETYKWRIEENELQRWRIEENKVVSGCRRRRLTADVEHCLDPERKLCARMNHLEEREICHC